MNHQMFAIHILPYQGVSGTLRHDARLVEGKERKFCPRSHAQQPFRWHHSSFFNVKVERLSIHQTSAEE